jgi:lipoprotein signal peptidase
MQTFVMLLSAVSLVALDQAVKVIVVARAAGGHLLHRKDDWLASLAALWLGELLLLALLVEVGPLAQSAWAAIALGAALGGAASNLIDRAARGRIVDFIDLRVWPVFNLADAAIAIGASTAALGLLCGW